MCSFETRLSCLLNALSYSTSVSVLLLSLTLWTEIPRRRVRGRRGNRALRRGWGCRTSGEDYGRRRELEHLGWCVTAWSHREVMHAQRDVAEKRGWRTAPCAEVQRTHHIGGRVGMRPHVGRDALPLLSNHNLSAAVTMTKLNKVTTKTNRHSRCCVLSSAWLWRHSTLTRKTSQSQKLYPHVHCHFAIIETINVSYLQRLLLLCLLL